MSTKNMGGSATKTQSREVKKRLEKDRVDFIYPKEYLSESKLDFLKMLSMLLNSKFIVSLLSLLTSVILFLLNRH